MHSGTYFNLIKTNWKDLNIFKSIFTQWLSILLMPASSFMQNILKSLKLLRKYIFSWRQRILQTLTLLEKESLNCNHGFSNINTVKWWEISKNNGFKSSKPNKVMTQRKIVMEIKRRKQTTSNFDFL